MKKSSARTAKRKWGDSFCGLSLAQTPGGWAIDDVLPKSPAERAKVKVEDVIVSVKGQPLKAPADLLAAGTRSVAFALTRQAKKRKVSLTPATRVQVGQWLMDIIEGATYARRVCDASCNCVAIDDTTAICSIWYLPKGKGPHGGVLLEKHCTSNSAGGGAEKTCSTKEYF
jgi:PDZ domain